MPEQQLLYGEQLQYTVASSRVNEGVQKANFRETSDWLRSKGAQPIPMAARPFSLGNQDRSAAA